MAEFILSIDIGTTTLRTAIVTGDGELHRTITARIETRYPAAGRVEQDANGIWCSLQRLIEEVLAASGLLAADLACIGVTSQRASIVVWNRKGEAVQPMVVWSDLRGVDRAAELMADGFLVAPQMSAAKLEATFADALRISGTTRSSQPDLLWGNIESFVIYRLTGGRAHITDASHYWPMGYLDLVTLGVNNKLIEHQGLNPRCFPTLVDSYGDLAHTSSEVLGREIPITAVIADAQSAMFAHNLFTPGACKITYGTAACVNTCTGNELILVAESIPPFVQYQHLGITGFCLEGMVNTAGITLEWMVHQQGIAESVAELLDLAGSVESTRGVWMLPALQGLGAPHGRPEERLRMGGMSSTTDRRHLARACIEGICYRVREIIDATFSLSALPLPGSVGIDGGLSESDLLATIQANVLGVQIRQHRYQDATALGAAAAAGLGAGLIEQGQLSTFANYRQTFDPTISRLEADAAFADWQTCVYSASSTAAGSST